MPLVSVNGLQFFQFESFQHEPLKHGLFMRTGGVSPSPWKSLNVGGTVGDDPVRVGENRRRIFNALDLDLDSAYDVWQVHSADLVIADSPRAGREYQRADIILTSSPGVTLFMRFADCVPILLYDPTRHVIGLAHAGWLGTVRQVARVAVEGMRTYFGSEPADVIAGIGPAIGPDHYEVGRDVISAIEDSFGHAAAGLLHPRDGRTYLDLYSANRSLLTSAGVEQIEATSICTACSVSEWFSHRAEGGRTGRFGALLSLTERS
ncbi:MAG: peptidoglycan editing factor PgeF [Anaerolineales bacterium]